MTEAIKKKRQVFGRLVKLCGEKSYKFEMKQDGIHVRQSRCRTVVVVPFGHIAGMAKKQLEFPFL